MNDNELEAFVKISDENGEISKNDIIIQVNMWISMNNGVWSWNIDCKGNLVRRCQDIDIIFKPFLKKKHVEHCDIVKLTHRYKSIWTFWDWFYITDKTVELLEGEHGPKKSTWQPLYKGARNIPGYFSVRKLHNILWVHFIFCFQETLAIEKLLKYRIHTIFGFLGLTLSEPL